MSGAKSLREAIDQGPVSAALWLLVALCFGVAMADGMDVAIIGFLTPALAQDWHVSKLSLGLAMSAAPAGLVVGALGAGPLADRWGRKLLLVLATGWFGAWTLAAITASSPLMLGVLRFLAGLGMGAAMPSALTLLSEYAPVRRKSLIGTLMFTGFNAGSALIGLAAAQLIPAFGWRAVLLLGGSIGLGLAPLLGLFLPESAAWLLLRGADWPRVATAFRRGTGQAWRDEFAQAAPPAPRSRGLPVWRLFTDGYATTTLALWGCCFLGLTFIYLFTGWLPSMMRGAGISIRDAANTTALFQIGGTVGAIAVGWAMDRWRPVPALATAYGVGGLCALLLGLFGFHSAWFGWLVGAAGFCLSGAQTGLNAMAPACYPTETRVTGVGWMLGVGRFGAIEGSAAGGWLVTIGLPSNQILAGLAIPALLAGAAIFAVRSHPVPKINPSVS